ncbi:MAG: FAD-dependent oxidoreductase, partial [Chloroflexi bacterium]|nr:FAD-dependent oxidoreductase [Chloroflexota bacterium]
VGGGIAALSAGWRLQQTGFEDFKLLELEREPGGTSRSGSSSVSSYPWGAHYVPLPQPSNKALRRLFAEMSVFEPGAEGSSYPVVAEHVLCREPQERLFAKGQWFAGLFPHSIASDDDLRQWEAFGTEIKRWIDWRDLEGRPAFTIPVANCSHDEEVVRLDKISMSDWLQEKGWTSEPLRWWVDYSCRDDYGLTVDQTSAWAGLFYFAARIDRSEDGEQPLLTWPEGNGRIVDHLVDKLGAHVESGQAVVSVEPPTRGDEGQTKVVVFDVKTRSIRGLLADQVIFAVPQFLAPYLIRGLSPERKQVSKAFKYGAWVVANLHLSERPHETGIPLSWDNVLYDSSSLGYVVATHQVGSDFGPTVWTWYLPLCDPLPADARRKLLDLKWEHWAEVVLSDLEVAHPEIRELVERLDVMHWGHAMIQPRPGFVWSKERQAAAKPVGPVHFAGTDLSGVALMEEAFYHGVRSAEEVLTARETHFSSVL